jgi:hypothetical protein
MATNGADFKIIKEKKIDKNATLKISKNLMSGRIFVEFASIDPKIVLQKNFQDSREGKLKSEEFAKSIRNTDQLREYFGLKREVK